MLHLGDSTLAQAVFHVPHCDMLGILVQRVSITPDELLPGCKPQPFSPSLPQLQLTDKCEQLVVHARTKVEGYKPPAHWEWVARVQEVVAVPVYANGDIWSLEDWRRCREVSGAENIMLGRGLVSRPDLARQIAAAKAGQQIAPMSWEEFRPVLLDFWQQARGKIAPRYAPGRLKQWLALLTRNYLEAVALFAELRRESDCARIDAMLGVDTRELRAAALA